MPSAAGALGTARVTWTASWPSCDRHSRRRWRETSRRIWMRASLCPVSSTLSRRRVERLSLLPVSVYSVAVGGGMVRIPVSLLLYFFLFITTSKYNCKPQQCIINHTIAPHFYGHLSWERNNKVKGARKHVRRNQTPTHEGGKKKGAAGTGAASLLISSPRRPGGTGGRAGLGRGLCPPAVGRGRPRARRRRRRRRPSR